MTNVSYAADFGPVDPDCQCTICRPREEGGLGITRAYIHHLAGKETVGAHLLTMHNVHYLLNLMKLAREAILEDRYPQFVKDFFARLYPDREDYPRWAINALSTVNIAL
jgi:tRNA-guanine family transglycosylase